VKALVKISDETTLGQTLSPELELSRALIFLLKRFQEFVELES
jgi:hypothetical protein